MKKIIVLVMFPIWLMGQAKGVQQIVNPDGKWYFGAELGANDIRSYSYVVGKTSLQGGLSAEYYTGRHWSLSLRVKYFDTGISYLKYDNYLINSDGNRIQRFDGSVICYPLNVKWEFRIMKNLCGFLKTGIAYNQEVRRNYDFGEDRTDYRQTYYNYNNGMGFTYFISEHMAASIEVENYQLGGNKGNDGWLFVPVANMNNTLYNMGFKYHFNE